MMQTGKHAIIFDMDGTLFQTETLAIPAFHRTFERLAQHGLDTGPLPTDERIASSFGMTSVDLWGHVLPEASEETREIADRWMLEEELLLLQEGKGVLYPNVREVLSQLDEAGWPLFIASNGTGPYVRGIVDAYGLNAWFKGIYTAGEYQTRAKEELVKRLMEDHQVTGGYMVGDRSSDVQAGKENGLMVIGCRYAGFPQFSEEKELQGADFLISSFTELLERI